MQVELTDKVEQMAVAVDEARKNGFAFYVDDTASRWNCDLATLADCFESIAFDYDDGVFQRGPAGSVDEGSALNDQWRRVLRFAPRRRQPDEREDKDHCI